MTVNFSLRHFQRIYELSDEMESFRETVQEFAENEIKPLADITDRTDQFPMELWKKMGEQGLLGITAGEDYGGLNMGYQAHCLAMEEISRASGSIGLSYAAHSQLCVNQLNNYGTKQQKEKYLEKLLTGEMVGALAMSEPNAGSDVVSMKTTAENKGDHFILNGTKMWITNGSIADVILVYAKTDHGKITCFIVETSQKGFSVGQKLDKLGMRGSPTSEIVFDNLEIPQENILGEFNKGVYVLMSGLDSERLVLSAGPVGIMQSCMDEVLNYITYREQFGQKIGEFQLMQGKIADMYVKLQSTRAYLHSLARLADNGYCNKNDCAGVILMASDNAVNLSLEAIQCFGGNGYINEYPTGRFLRDAKLYTIGAGTNEIRRWLIGRSLVNEFSY